MSNPQISWFADPSDVEPALTMPTEEYEAFKAAGWDVVALDRLTALELLAAAVKDSYEYLTARGYPTSATVREQLERLAALDAPGNLEQAP
jgi:hypothetical protein